jgi:hypothetical protein
MIGKQITGKCKTIAGFKRSPSFKTKQFFNEVKKLYLISRFFLLMIV